MFQAIGLPFCWLPFPWSFYFLKSIWAENLKLRMLPIRLKHCNFCNIPLLNNKNLECGRTSIKRCYTQGFYIFSGCTSLFPEQVHRRDWKTYYMQELSGVLIFPFFKPLVESPLLLASVSFSIFCSKSIDLKCFPAFGRIFLFAGFFSLLKLFQAVGLPFCWLAFPWSFLFLRPIWAEHQNWKCGPLELKIAFFVSFTC